MEVVPIQPRVEPTEIKPPAVKRKKPPPPQLIPVEEDEEDDEENEDEEQDDFIIPEPMPSVKNKVLKKQPQPILPKPECNHAPEYANDQSKVFQNTCSVFMCTECSDESRKHAVLELPNGKLVITFVMCNTCRKVNAKVNDVIDAAIRGSI